MEMKELYDSPGGLRKLNLFFRLVCALRKTKCNPLLVPLRMWHLSWWNGYTKTLGIANANYLSCTEVMKFLIERYYPQEEMQKLEQELWKVTMTNVDIISYTNLFNDLAPLYPRFVTSEYKKVERYIFGLV